MLSKRTNEEIDEAIEELLASKGWEIYCELQEESKMQLTAMLMDYSQTNENLRLIQGRLVQIAHILGFKDAVEQEKANAAAEAEEDADV